jgi:hypothetical protein
MGDDIMRDEIFDRDYQNGRAELHAGIDRLVRKAARGALATFDALHRIEWAAPWDQKRDRTGVA